MRWEWGRWLQDEMGVGGWSQDETGVGGRWSQDEIGMQVLF